MYQQSKTKPIGERIAASRVDMLIAIYDAAIQAAEETETKLRSEHSHEAALASSKAVALVELLESGLNLDQGEIPNRIRDLCQFVERSLLTSNADEIAAATRILKNLRDGFAGIKDEAVQLESAGQIPPLQTTSIDTVI